ncbi:type II/IV secretion system protein, partial [bacterium]|nr:type II/IV secretion system protein [bacterium]
MPLYEDSALYDTLKELKVIPDDSLEGVFEYSKTNKKLLEDVLIERDLITDKNLGEVVADMLSVPFVSLSEVYIEEEILQTIPEIVAKKQRTIVFKKDKEGLHVASTNPKNTQIIEFVGKKVGSKVTAYYATRHDFDNALNLYAKDVKEAFGDIIAKNVREAQGVGKAEPSIIKIVDTTVVYAYQNKASDIHVEPIGKASLIRFRIDGILHDIVELPIDLHPQIVTRIKVLAKLRTDEHQAAQDGKISYKTKKEDLDIRVSIVPITDGEKIVMRLLSERSRQFSLQDLGFYGNDLKKLREAYKRPHGMILATGPTGSGKTTTLYAILKILNKRNVNIMTIEDPVEYDIQHVNQIQVNPKTGLTFAKGLRSIVRQDPDMILVGEIRDEDTADISINAAMTGHLVLSTLHT